MIFSLKYFLFQISIHFQTQSNKMSFKLKSKDKIVTAFTKIFRRDKLKTDDPHLEESNKNDKVGNDNTDNTLDHANNNNVANRNHFKNELVSPMKNIPKGLYCLLIFYIK